PLRSSLHKSLRSPAFTLSRNVSQNFTTPSPEEPNEKSTSIHEEIPRPSSSALTEKPVSAPDPSSELKQRIRKFVDESLLKARTRADEFSAAAKTTFSQLGLQLNKVTGYEEIEALKRRVVEQEASINNTREAARQAKAAYDRAVAQRSDSQREINDLLQRKSLWNQADIARFTTLIPQDHVLEQAEAQARLNVQETEDAVEREFTGLMRTILNRYHEEQVWSDKIRSASTYGSLAALGLNLFVFVTAIIFVEPWKRKRLAATFEKKIEEMNRENEAMTSSNMREIQLKLDAQTQLLARTKIPIPEIVISPTPVEDRELGSEPALPVELYRRIWSKAQDPEVGGTMLGAAAVAGIVGWLMRTWVGN
ncbi:unnamed protein product, partial [Mycena citricolor]